MRQVIGVLGKMGSGKSEAANLAKQTYGAAICPLAEPVRTLGALVLDGDVNGVFNAANSFIEELFPEKSMNEQTEILLELQELVKRVQPKKGEKNRAFLQQISTDIARKHNKRVWVNWRLKNIPADGLVIVDDVRFQNEVDAILAAGGRVIRIMRPELDRIDYLLSRFKVLTEDHLNHPSENDLNTYQCETIMATSLDSLYEQFSLWLKTGKKLPVMEYKRICCGYCATERHHMA